VAAERRRLQELRLVVRCKVSARYRFKFEFGRQRSRSPWTKKQTTELFQGHAEAVRCMQQQMTALCGHQGVTVVHIDGGLRAIMLGAVLAGAAMPVGKSVHAV